MYMYCVLRTLHHDTTLLCYMYVHSQNARTLKSPGSPLLLASPLWNSDCLCLIRRCCD